ncbi:MAG TPA: L,D-transpeptidase family protein [Chthoniobacterales bacterium]|nr:L,D-transpeptidase family protein [Chthoniobacterales bacterium]
MIATARAHAAGKTVEDRLAEFGDVVRARLLPRFEAAGVSYPPRQLTLIGIKDERVLDVYAAGADGVFRFVWSYPVLGASGVLGPKLREGDRQVPEGVYRVPELNPNSDFHLSIRLNYPNEIDQSQAAAEGRTNLGGDIMIHGDSRSRGCLAMGDPAAEDLFVLAALTGIENITVILTPVDFRDGRSPELANGAPPWTPELYERIKRELARYPRRPQT